MKRSNTFLFALFLVIDLAGLLFINYLPIYSYLNSISTFIIPVFSVSLVVLIIFAFTYREFENNKIENEFITIITHKFRTPLTGIRWSINMLQKDLTLLEKKDLLMEMEKANERLMEIVDLLVGFVRFDRKLEYAFVAVSLREVVDVSVTKYGMMARSKNITLELNSDKSLPLIIIDKAKIQFVIDMLIDNAIKYTPSNGHISISFAMDKKSITVMVTDNGIGFDFWEGCRIFKHFYRSGSAKLADTEGLGLGLYTAKKIVANHNGRLTAYSAGKNKGSTFSLNLPIKK